MKTCYRFFNFMLLAFTLLAFLATPWLPAAEKDAAEKSKADQAQARKLGPYLRLTLDDDKEPATLDTAIVSFVKNRDDGGKVQVDLIGAIHVADKSYFEALNKRFKKYDAVLYELVAPENANVPQPGRGSGSAIGGLQVGMTAMLELAFQLDHIDYAAKNLVHADMTPDEFSATMKKRNESFLGMFARMMGRSFAQQAKDPVGSGDLQVLAAMLAEDRAFRLKRIMAQQFANMEGELAPFGGPQGSTIITERNKKALTVLARELEAGRKKVAIFYGAGHLADFEERLIDEFGMKRGKTKWLQAWSLARKDKPQEPKAD